MGFVRVSGLGIVLLLCGACASAPRQSSGGSFEAGYRQGVREDIHAAVEKMTGNDFPYLAGTWEEPLVQKTRIPAHVQGGVLYPEHDELVIITPGEWRRAGGYPLRVAREGERVADGNTDITSMPQ